MPKTSSQWLDEISRRLRTLKRHWRDDADRCVAIYEADKAELVPFNILYSNTETLLPALYNSTPRPEVSRRYTQIDADRVLDSALSQCGERLLEYFADSNVLEYETFDTSARAVVLSALVAGMGTARVRYREEGGYQELSFEAVPYDRFVWGYARKWCHVPWVAYGHDYSKADFERAFPAFVKTAAYRAAKWDEVPPDDEEDAAKRNDETGAEGIAGALVWEIWDADSRQIYIVSSRFRDSFIEQRPYPFPLSSRFPSPQPLTFVKRTNNLTPVPPYMLYKRQAEELNEVTRRLHIVLKAIKVRGGYNGQMTEIAQILEGDDTALIPIENASLMGESGSFEKHIWLLPITELITVARELYAAQLNAKNTIYEIMGIADILRGSSVASETAKAQEIKNRWGTLRVKRMQTDVQSFCRDLFRIAFEFGAALFTPATLKAITKLPYLFEAEKRALAGLAQAGAQPPPGLAEKAALLQAPSWEDISRLLQDSYERTYRIDVETNSTVDLEATEDKAEVAEFMNAWGQMMSGFQPLITAGVMPFEVVKLVISEVFRRFRFSRRIEGALEVLQPPQLPEDSAVVEARYKAELAAARADAKRQIGEMQETIIELTGEIERLRIENMALKKSADIAQEAGKLEATRIATDGKLREHVLQRDYAGKMALQQQQSADRERKLREELVKRDLEAVAKKVEGDLDVLRAQVGEVRQVGNVFTSAIEAQNKMLADAMSQLSEQINGVARLAAAEREAELFIGPDGKKRSRSRIVITQ